MPDLTPHQREVLATVADLNQSATPAHARVIARHSALTQVQTADALTQLYQAGLIKLLPGHASGSSAGWQLTAAGAAQVKVHADGI